MGNFITYGVTEMLDNDQKFIIDSDRTGPGSITAKDAASSLLSKWAGFDTFEEAVQNTISNNQEFIDRDTAIRSETAELKKKIVTTFPAKDASGAVATFESEFEDAPLKSCIVRVEPVQDLHGYDHPWPAGGGKNKLLFKTDDLTASKYGMELSYNATTEVITVTGTETHGSAFSIATTYQYRLPKFVAGETYTISRTQVTGNLDENIYFQITYRKLDGTSSALVLNRTASTTFTVPNDFDIVTNIFVGVFAGVSDVNNAFKLQLEIGSTATDWTPYNENICPITGWTGCEVQRTGKNLADEEAIFGTLQGWTSSDGVYTGETAIIHATYGNGIPGLKFKPSTQYTVSVRYSGSMSAIGMVIEFSYTDGTSNIRYCNSVTPDDFQLVSSVGKTIEKVKLSYGRNMVVSISKFQIVEGSTATAYELYTGQTYPITFPSEAGTVYGAYVDVTGGELVVTHAEVDMGSLEWYKSTSPQRFESAVAIDNCKAPSLNSDVADILIECYKTVSANTTSENSAIAMNTAGLLRVYDSGKYETMSRQEFKAAMSGVQLLYPLAEPIHYPLTPTEIKTLLGTNNIWANTGNTAVEYLMSDVSWYVEKKLRAFQSVLAGVEDSAVASKNYSTDSYLIFNDDIYMVTKAITAGETIEEGVNVTKTTVAEQLMALAQA